jgi:hypothetical protein
MREVFEKGASEFGSLTLKFDRKLENKTFAELT